MPRVDPNPYASPAETNEDRAGSASIQYRVFSAKAFSFRLTEHSVREGLRREAQLAIDAEIGVNNVVAINESYSLTGYSLTVWYRA